MKEREGGRERGKERRERVKERKRERERGRGRERESLIYRRTFDISFFYDYTQCLSLTTMNFISSLIS